MKERIKLVLLFIFGITLTVFTIFLGTSWQQWISLPKKAEIERFAPKLPLSQKKIATASINFNPSELTVYQNEELKIGILLKSEAKIVGADLNFKFNPTTLEIKQIKPGNFFSSPQEIKKTIDVEKGEIFYSLGSLSSQKGEGVLMELIFKAKKPGTTEVSLAEGTQIAAEKIDEVKIDLPVLGKYIILE